MTITVETVVYIAGLIVTVGAAVKIMYNVGKGLAAPIDKINDRLDGHDECLKRDKAALDRLDADTKQILLSEECVLAHLETGNHTGEIAQRRKDLNEYFIMR